MKAQGSTEYLVTLGVILFLGLIVGVVLFYPVGTTKDVKQSQSDIKYKIQAMNPSSLNDGLVAYWKFDEGSGAVSYDSINLTGGSLHNGASWTSGKSGSALQFDGVNDWFNTSMDYSWAASDSFTIAYWVSPATITANQCIMGKGNAGVWGDYNWDWTFCLMNSTLSFTNWNTDGQGSIGGSTSVGLNDWTHIAITYDPANKAKFYKNGALASSDTTILSPFQDRATPMIMGHSYYSNGANYYFNGTIDEVLVYNRALTADEIGVLYTVPNILKTDSIFNSN